MSAEKEPIERMKIWTEDPQSFIKNLKETIKEDNLKSPNGLRLNRLQNLIRFFFFFVCNLIR